MSEAQADAEALFERARSAIAEQRAEEAEAHLRAALALAPQSHGVRLLLAEALLMQGRWEEGWAFNEHRPGRLNSPIRGLPYPEWRGEPLAGRSLLVWGEQALGDEIQMARFVPGLKERGAGRVTLGCHPFNLRLFQQLGADLTISRGADGDISVPRHDLWVMLGSLPHRLCVTPQNLSGAPYLKAPTPAPRSGGVGLVERGNPKNPRDAERSLPPGLLAQAFPNAAPLVPSGDMLESAKALAALDLLISVDTSWAHLAGALGVPCRILLPHRRLDWRWLRERTDTPWYDSVRLFRRGAQERWEDVVARAAGAAI